MYSAASTRSSAGIGAFSISDSRVLIGADLAQGSGTDITGNIAEVGRSNEPNPLNIGPRPGLEAGTCGLN